MTCPMLKLMVLKQNIIFKIYTRMYFCHDIKSSQNRVSNVAILFLQLLVPSLYDSD
jgi:hypothetical protein